MLRKHQLIHNLPSLLSLEKPSHCISDPLAIMAHELRTPLSMIFCSIQVLREQNSESFTASQRSFFDHIYQSACHMMAVINTTLDLSKVERDMLKLRPEPIALPEALVTAIDRIRPLADMKRLTLTLHAEGAPATLTADPIRFTQILLNLLSNAVTFTPEGGRIMVTAKVVPSSECQVPGIEPGTPKSPDLVEISVTDTGIGIKIEDLPKLSSPSRNFCRTIVGPAWVSPW